jgi:hypothetical protein
MWGSFLHRSWEVSSASHPRPIQPGWAGQGR